MAQPINTTAGFSPLPLSPRGCSPEGVVSAKGWARGSVYSDVGESHGVANVSAQGVCCVLRNSGGACDGARAGHNTPPKALPTSQYTPPQPSHGANIRRAHLCARRGAGGSPRVTVNGLVWFGLVGWAGLCWLGLAGWLGLAWLGLVGLVWLAGLGWLGWVWLAGLGWVGWVGWA